MALAAKTLDTEPPVIVVEAGPAKLAPAQTSVAMRGKNPGEVDVQFRRWTAFGNTAYQAYSYAGFPAAVALRLEAAGSVFIDPAYVRAGHTGYMVRK